MVNTPSRSVSTTGAAGAVVLRLTRALGIAAPVSSETTRPEIIVAAGCAPTTSTAAVLNAITANMNLVFGLWSMVVGRWSLVGAVQARNDERPSTIDHRLSTSEWSYLHFRLRVRQVAELGGGAARDRRGLAAGLEAREVGPVAPRE